MRDIFCYQLSSLNSQVLIPNSYLVQITTLGSLIYDYNIIRMLTLLQSATLLSATAIQYSFLTLLFAILLQVPHS